MDGIKIRHDDFDDEITDKKSRKLIINKGISMITALRY